jgi:glycosyltransferase involved in cell wall biosynthesis
MQIFNKDTTSRIKISVIVPTLNEEKYIGNLLKSLTYQTFKNFEVIVVDGGSSDRTIQIAEKYGAKVIVKPRLKEFSSRNVGAEIAYGEILLFTSADVIFYPTTLEKLYEKINKCKLGGLCGFGRVYDAPLWGVIEYYFYYSIVWLLTRCVKYFRSSTNFMAVRKKGFFEIGGFQDRIEGDGIFSNLFTQRYKVKFINGKNYFLVSGRRMRKLGFFGFNIHFLYVIEVILPFLSETRILKYFKDLSFLHRIKEKFSVKRHK